MSITITAYTILIYSFTPSFILFCSSFLLSVSCTFILLFSAQATVEGVYEDYHSRSAYVAYLVKSQQKFQDTKLQVAAVQSAVDRCVCVCVCMCVPLLSHFAHLSFLYTQNHAHTRGALCQFCSPSIPRKPRIRHETVHAKNERPLFIG